MKVFDSYEFLITPLSPLHIGTDESYEPTNYVIEDDTLYEFDTGALIDILTDEDRRGLANAVNGRPDISMIKNVQRFFFERREVLIAHAINRLPVLKGVSDLYINRIGRTAQREQGGRQIINLLEIDRTSFNPVNRVPVLFGSSLKGAIRTALLDAENNGKDLTYKGEKNRELQERLFKYPAGRFELDPMRLLQISDAAWSGEPGIPAAEVYLAVNRKKAPVKDDRGNLRQSLAEQKGPPQMLECVPPWRYRAFKARLNIQRVEGMADKARLPDPALRFDIGRIASACNNFYKAIISEESRLLDDRGFISKAWIDSITKLLDGEIGQKLANGEAFLLRVGRHSGAESVTVRGVRNIKIMKGKGESPDYDTSARTVWLAAEEVDKQQDMLPFGWLLVEIQESDVEKPECDLFKDICEKHMTQARAWAERQADKAQEREKIVREAEEKRRVEEEKARFCEEEKAREAKAEEDRQARLASMSEEMRAVEEFREFYKSEKTMGSYQPGRVFDEKRLSFFKLALSWDDVDKRNAAAALLRETISQWTGWPPNKERKQEFRKWLEDLEKT